jgi:hypothetical protein
MGEPHEIDANDPYQLLMVRERFRLLETLAHAALGQTEAAKISLISARRLRPELTLREVEISHGRQAAKALIDLWAEARP